MGCFVRIDVPCIRIPWGFDFYSSCCIDSASLLRGFLPLRSFSLLFLSRLTCETEESDSQFVMGKADLKLEEEVGESGEGAIAGRQTARFSFDLGGNANYLFPVQLCKRLVLIIKSVVCAR